MEEQKSSEGSLSDLGTRLLSEDLTVREETMVSTRELARQGSSKGKRAWEEAIRAKRGYQSVKFYVSGGRKFFSGGLSETAEAEVLQLAAGKMLWKPSPEDIQGRFLSPLFNLGNALGLLRDVGCVGGCDQAMAIQLLARISLSQQT